MSLLPRRLAILGGLVAIGLALPSPAAAQRTDESVFPEGRWSVGFQAAYPSYGIGVRLDTGEKLAYQAVLGVFGALTTVGAQLDHYFERKEKWSTYGYGSAGLFRYSAFGHSENGFGAGAGVGIELDWPAIFESEDFPPLYSTIQLGLGFAALDLYEYSAIGFGGGLHYRF